MPSTFSCRLQWKARRAEIEVLAKQAADLSEYSKRIPVLADTTLVRAFQGRSAAQPADQSPRAVGRRQSSSDAHSAQSPPTWRFLLCFTQMWMSKSGQAFPPFACTVLNYFGRSIHHPHQMSLAQFSAYHLREIIFNLDMLVIARTTKLTTTSKEKTEDETLENVNVSGLAVETEFYGGEQADQLESEDEDVHAEAWHPRFPLGHDRLTAILSRHSEIAGASRKGRKSASVMQMKVFNDCFHSMLNKPVPACNVQRQKAQLSYAHPNSIIAALLHQDAILTEMRNAQKMTKPKLTQKLILVKQCCPT